MQATNTIKLIATVRTEDKIYVVRSDYNGNFEDEALEEAMLRFEIETGANLGVQAEVTLPGYDDGDFWSCTEKYMLHLCNVDRMNSLDSYI